MFLGEDNSFAGINVFQRMENFFDKLSDAGGCFDNFCFNPYCVFMEIYFIYSVFYTNTNGTITKTPKLRSLENR